MTVTLCARVEQPNKKDWNPLVRHVKFLHETQDHAMTFEISQGVSAFEWCIDASCAAHPDFRSQIGATCVFGGSIGCAINMSAKQKLNIVGSTVAEFAAEVG